MQQNNHNVDVKLFSGIESEYLASKIADFYGFNLGDKTLLKFSDGEMQPIINESVRGSYVFLIQSNKPPQNFLPTRTIGKRPILCVCIKVIASKSSSKVPKPPGMTTNP